MLSATHVESGAPKFPPSSSISYFNAPYLIVPELEDILILRKWFIQNGASQLLSCC